ncbi:MAG TPA: hypothetical protein VI895_07840 [Bdellovibrionota bacterium]|nr:hypothetical protein [Bdellovibrionota bacterium]
MRPWRRKRAISLLWGPLPLFFLAPVAASTLVDQTVAVVGKRVLTLHDVEVDYVLSHVADKERLPTVGDIRSDPNTFDRALRTLVSKALIQNYVENTGLLLKAPPEKIARTKADLRRLFSSEPDMNDFLSRNGIEPSDVDRFAAEHARSEQFMEEHVAGRVTLNEAEMRAFYDREKNSRFLGKSYENVENLVRTQLLREKIKKEFEKWRDTEMRRTDIVLLPVDLPQKG